MNRIKVMLVDDHPAFRLGVATALREESDLNVVAECASAEEALALAPDVQPEVVLLDLRLPSMNGLECLRRLKKERPSTKIIILTTFDQDHDLAVAVQHGAAGYLLKDCSLDVLCQTIRQTVAGQRLVEKALLQKATAEMKRPASPHVKMRFYTAWLLG